MVENLQQKAKEIYRKIIELELQRKVAGSSVQFIREQVGKLERKLIEIELDLKQR